MAAPGVALMQMANANLNPWTEAKLDPKNPDRGPLLIIDGEKDHTVPWAIANAAYKRQRHNEAVTEIEKIPNRGHALTIDSGWREVAADGARLRQAVRLAPELGHGPVGSLDRIGVRQRHRPDVGDRLGVLGRIAAANSHGIPSG